MDHVTLLQRIVSNVEKVIVDKRFSIELILIALVCRGHVLIEDVPGVGKTSVASALARSLNCSFQRIQFTPDIMPSDITGFSVFNPKTGDFTYKRGLILHQVVLADEINRTSPKTQASLLEAMEEKQVTVDGKTYRMGEPFIVLATQNPVEFLGTYPLPEAQMDRFFMRLSLGYPSREEERRMTVRFGGENPLQKLQAVAAAEHIAALQKIVEQIHMDQRISAYIVDLVRHTRQNPFVALGASPRASISLYKASQAWAMFQGRNYVLPDDVIDMCPHVMAHRVMLSQEAKVKRVSQDEIVRMALQEVELPLVENL